MPQKINRRSLFGALASLPLVGSIVKCGFSTSKSLEQKSVIPLSEFDWLKYDGYFNSKESAETFGAMMVGSMKHPSVWEVQAYHYWTEGLIKRGQNGELVFSGSLSGSVTEAEKMICFPGPWNVQIHFRGLSIRPDNFSLARRKTAMYMGTAPYGFGVRSVFDSDSPQSVADKLVSLLGRRSEELAAIFSSVQGVI